MAPARAIVLLGLLCAGCGRLSDDGGGVADGSIDSGTNAADASADSDESPPYFGSVVVSDDPVANPLGEWFAGFVAWNKPVPPLGVASCPGSQLGACCYLANIDTESFMASGVLGLTGMADGVNAGSVSVGSAGRVPQTRMFDAGGYFFSMPYTFLWGPGEKIEISGTGDVVHAFMGSIVGPGGAAGLSPSIDSSDLVIQLNKDWSMNWTPGDAGADNTDRLTLQLTNCSGANDTSEILCDVPYSAGQLTVPTALLGNMPPTTEDGGCLYSGGVVWHYTLGRANADNAVVLLYAGVETHGHPKLQ
jgi:hypothetical protein